MCIWSWSSLWQLRRSCSESAKDSKSRSYALWRCIIWLEKADMHKKPRAWLRAKPLGQILRPGRGELHGERSLVLPGPLWSELKDTFHGVTLPNLKLWVTWAKERCLSISLLTHFILLETFISHRETAFPLDESELCLFREKGDLEESILLF